MRTIKINQAGSMMGAIALLATLWLPGRAAATVFVDDSTPVLHYDTQAAFNNDWQLTYNEGYGNPQIVNAGGADGTVLQGGGLPTNVYGNFLVYNPNGPGNSTVFDVSGAGPDRAFIATKDFRLASLPNSGAVEQYVINLAAVSTAGTHSLMASVYSNAGAGGAATVYLRFDDWNFDTGTFNTNFGITYPVPGPFSINLADWYRMQYTMTRELADPTKVDLTLAVYDIVGGVKGGATGALVESYTLTEPALGNDVQFGMKADANSYYTVYSDNFQAEVIIPEPSTFAFMLLGLAGLLVRRQTKI